MTKRALLVVAAFLGVCQWLPAQPPGALLFNNGLFDQPSISSPWLSLESQDRFMFSTAFGSMRATEQYLPAFDPSAPLSVAYLSPDNKNSVDRVVDLSAPSRIQFGGEFGFLYGKSTGKYGREETIPAGGGNAGFERSPRAVSRKASGASQDFGEFACPGLRAPVTTRSQPTPYSNPKHPKTRRTNA